MVVLTFRNGEEVFISVQDFLSTELHALLVTSSCLIPLLFSACLISLTGTSFVGLCSTLGAAFGCFNFSLRGKGARGTGT